MLRVREKTAVYNAKREASGETNPIDTKILNIWPSELSVDQAIQYFFFVADLANAAWITQTHQIP